MIDRLRNTKAIRREIQALQYINDTMLENHLADIRTFPSLFYLIERIEDLKSVLKDRRNK